VGSYSKTVRSLLAQNALIICKRWECKRAYQKRRTIYNWL